MLYIVAILVSFLDPLLYKSIVKIPGLNLNPNTCSASSINGVPQGSAVGPVGFLCRPLISLIHSLFCYNIKSILYYYTVFYYQQDVLTVSNPIPLFCIDLF